MSSMITCGVTLVGDCMRVWRFVAAGDVVGGVKNDSGYVVGVGSSSIMWRGAITSVIGSFFLVDLRLLRLAWR